MSIDMYDSCYNCVHCFACAIYLDDGKRLTRKKIKEICEVMGGFRRKEDK